MPFQKTSNCVLRPVLFLCLVSSLCSLLVSAKEPIVTGWIEGVYLLPENFRLRAKVDTGAHHSSLNAIDAVLSEREGKTMVEFTITNGYGETILIEKPVHQSVETVMIVLSHG